RLHDRALDLVDQPVGVDHLAAVDGGHRAHRTRSAGLAVDLDPRGNGAIRREIFVARERKTEAAPLRCLLPLLPAKTLRRLVDDVAPAQILQMLQPEFDGMGAGRTRE